MSAQSDVDTEVNPFVAKMADILDKSAASQRKAVLTQTEKMCNEHKKQIDKLMKKIDKMETESSMSMSASEGKSSTKKVRAPKAPH